MRYGNTVRDLKRCFLAIGAFGVIAAAVSSVMLIFVEHVPLERILPVVLLFIAVLPVLVTVLAVGPTACFSIHVDGGWVEQRFLDRYVLSRAEIRDYQQMKAPSVPFAAVLRFTGGKKIRIWGMHLGILSQLERDLKRLKEALPRTAAGE